MGRGNDIGIDWHFIRDNYPLAYAQFCEDKDMAIDGGGMKYFTRRATKEGGMERYFAAWWNDEPRDVVEYFEKEGIYIGIDIERGDNLHGAMLIYHKPKIMIGEDITITDFEPVTVRVLAEKEVITKAFDLYDQKLLGAFKK